jgi:hypothetical protein
LGRRNERQGKELEKRVGWCKNEGDKRGGRVKECIDREREKER